jgi:hypothetical protein
VVLLMPSQVHKLLQRYPTLSESDNSAAACDGIWLATDALLHYASET